MKTPTFVLSALTALLVMFSPLVATESASANGCITHSATADGTQAHPFLIENAYNLNCLFINSVDYWSGDPVTHDPLYFLQTADIDLSQYSPYVTGIGDVNVPFYGTYDGGGFQITGLALNGNAPLKGMFGKLDVGSSITDTHLMDASITVPGIDNFNNAGLLVGASDGAITRSSATGTITVTATDSASQIGGLVGSSLLSTISQSSADVQINILGNSDVFEVGGLVGTSDGTDISEVQSTGSILASGTHGGVSDLGGIVGMLLFGSLTNSWTSVSIDSQGSINANFFGSVVGTTAQTTISNVYSVGTIRMTSVNGADIQGAMIGRVGDNTTLLNSFWDTDSLGTSMGVVGEISFGSLRVENTLGLPSSYLRQYSTFATTQFLSQPWSIENGTVVAPTTVWGICNEASYPFLTALTSSHQCPAPTPVDPVAPLADTGSWSSELLGASALLLLAGSILLYIRRRTHV